MFRGFPFLPRKCPNSGAQSVYPSKSVLLYGTRTTVFYNLSGIVNADVSTTMIYLHVIKRPGAGGPSPLDLP